MKGSIYKMRFRKETIMMLITTFLLIALLNQVGADECGNRCTSSQICGTDGTCYERSDLVSCFSYTSIYTRHYCKKGQECCGDGCMPEGNVCCQTSHCDSGYTCCSFIRCCPAGTFCSSFSCVLDRYSTAKPTTPRPTYRPSTTSKPSTSSEPVSTVKRTTLKPNTRYPTRTYPSTNSSTESRTSYSSEWTTRWFKSKTEKSSVSNEESAFKPWHYAIIGVGVVFVVVVVALVIRGRRNTKSNAGAQGVTQRNDPAQNHGHASRGNVTGSGVSAQTNRPLQHINMAYVVTKPTVPTQANVQQNRGIILIVAKPNISNRKESNRDTSSSIAQ